MIRIIFIFVFISSISFAQEDLYLVDYGFHTGIIFKREFLLEQEFGALNELPSSKYYEFSIGEEPFFREREHTTVGKLRALFWPTENIIRVHPFNKNPIQYFKSMSGIAKFSIDDVKAKKIWDFVNKSFKSNYPVVEKQEKLARYFFKANGTYHLFSNCNDWSAKAFEPLGFKISFSAKVSSRKLFEQLVKHSNKSITNKDGTKHLLKYLN